MLSREKQAKSRFLRAAGLPLEKLQKELKGVGSTPIRSSISTLSSNSNYSSVIGVGGTLQFHPKELEWSPNLHIHSRSGPVSAENNDTVPIPTKKMENRNMIVDT